MTIKIPVALALSVAVIAPAAAPAAIHDPQSDAAMRKAIRDYARNGIKGSTLKATNLKVDCVQAAKIGSTRACSGTFSLTRNGRTAHYKLTSKSSTFRISPGAMEGRLYAAATSKVTGLRPSIKWSSILQ